MPRNLLGWLAILGVGLAAFLYGITAEGPPLTNADRAQRLGETYACEVCNGQSVAESNAPFAQQVRREIRKRIDDGQTNEQINAFLVGRFGEDIDLTPRATGLVGLVWILPVAFAVVGVFGLAAYFQRNRAVQPKLASSADRRLVDSARTRVAGETSEKAAGDGSQVG